MNENDREYRDSSTAEDIYLKLTRPVFYVCTHSGATDACEFANDHLNEPYPMEAVDQSTACPDCGHPGTLTPAR